MTRIRSLNSMLSNHPTICHSEMKECEALFFSLMCRKRTNNWLFVAIYMFDNWWWWRCCIWVRLPAYIGNFHLICVRREANLSPDIVHVEYIVVSIEYFGLKIDLWEKTTRVKTWKFGMSCVLWLYFCNLISIAIQITSLLHHRTIFLELQKWNVP